MEELISKIKEAYAIKLGLEQIDSDMQKLKSSKEELEKRLTELNSEVLEEMIKSDLREIETDDHIFATHYTRTDFTYGDEKTLLKYLKDKDLKDYLSVKTTVAINKNALKKDLKSKEDLKESLKDWVGDKVTDYVVVVDAETHQKMLEHMEEDK